FEVSEEEEGQAVSCPECGFSFVPDWSEVEEEDEEW
ncbi:MAG: paraquat-inducible protein A, partial [Meiothermus cerbereus]